MASRYIEAQLTRISLVRAGRTILNDIDWRIRPGERWLLAGANGAGKTQLLKLVAGAVWPEPTGRELRRYRWRGAWRCAPFEVQENIAYLGAERQDRYERYGWNHTVEQVVGTGRYRTDIPLDPLSGGDRQAIRVLLERLGIAALRSRPFLTLSYGERRLTLLARALAVQPRLLLLDELANGLDQEHRAKVLHYLAGLTRTRLPWVLATHRLEDVPPSLTHALVLDRGRVAFRGPIARAPLERWLATGRAPRRAVRRAPRHPRPAALVRLTRASVYLDGSCVLNRISFTVRSGECWVVHGRNGSGKTTLLRTLYGDHAVAASGSIERSGIVPGVPLESFKRRIGLVAPHLQAEHPRELSVGEVVESGIHASIGLAQRSRAADRDAAAAALDAFGLARLARRPLAQLSYGQLRRVLFARALVNRPALLLLDEPFAGIDAPTRRLLLQQIEALAARGVSMVIATHHRSEWPRAATCELELAGGTICYAGPLRGAP